MPLSITLGASRLCAASPPRLRSAGLGVLVTSGSSSSTKWSQNPTLYDAALDHVGRFAPLRCLAASLALGRPRRARNQWLQQLDQVESESYVVRCRSRSRWALRASALPRRLACARPASACS